MPDLNRDPECMSDLGIDRLLAERAEADERERVQAHLAACVRCALRYEAFANQRAAFLERVPTWQALHAQQQAATRTRRPGRWLWGAGAAAVAAAGVALLLSLPPRVAPPAVRSKGGPHIGAYVKHGERIERVGEGSAVFPGDHVRFTYSSDHPAYFALLNRDAQRVTTYFPLGDQTEPVAAGDDVALDFSIRLDAQPGREQVHGLFCDRPEPLAPLRAALQATGQLPPLPHCRVDVLTLEKRFE